MVQNIHITQHRTAVQHSYSVCILTGSFAPNSLSNSLAISSANLVSPTDCRLQMMDTTTPWARTTISLY